MVFFVFLIELFSFFFTKLKILPFSLEPTYSLTHPIGLGVAWRNEKLPWGAWHKANASDFHNLDCINVEYFSNDYGARDYKDYKELKIQKTFNLRR